MKVSFIIPAFNASSTIIRCLNSIDNLPLQPEEYEVIVIDDCSTDMTVRLVEEYSDLRNNIILLRQKENHRQGAARNRGVSIAKGKYIVFLDSDDEICLGVLSAIKIAEKGNLEMVALNSVRVSDGDSEKYSLLLPYKPEDVFSGVDFQSNHPFWGTAPWAYLYLNSFLKGVKYPFTEDVLYEDSDFVSVHLYHANKMGYCDQCAYSFYDNPSSVTHTISYGNVADYALLGTRMLEFYRLIDDKSSRFAQSILEGGSYNIMRACKKLFRLNQKSDVRSFYDRFDHLANRKKYLHFREPAYCWTRWTRFCLKYRKMTIFIVGCYLSLRFIKTK